MRLDAVQKLWDRLRASGGSAAVLDTDSFTESERSLGRMVLPAVSDLHNARATISHLEEKVKAIHVVLGLVPVAAIVLDERGTFLSSNEAARQLFGGEAVPECVVRVAARALRDGTEHDGARTPHPADHNLTLRVVPAQLANESGGPGVAFLVPSNKAPATIEVSLLQNRFGLTDMQAKVVSLVARGMSNREVSEHLHLSVETVRKHLAWAFEKTGVNTRAAVVALAYGVRFGQAGRIAS